MSHQPRQHLRMIHLTGFVIQGGNEVTDCAAAAGSFAPAPTSDVAERGYVIQNEAADPVRHLFLLRGTVVEFEDEDGEKNGDGRDAHGHRDVNT